VKIAELSHGEVVTADLADMLNQAASRMRYADVSALPVVENGCLVGILTERDLTRAAAEGVDPRTHTVAAFMSLGPVVVEPDDDAEEIADRMLQLGIRHLPVMEGQELVGIVSMRDLLRFEVLHSAAVAG
jgi:CBS domain-containing protein